MERYSIIIVGLFAFLLVTGLLIIKLDNKPVNKTTFVNSQEYNTGGSGDIQVTLNPLNVEPKVMYSVYTLPLKGDLLHNSAGGSGGGSGTGDVIVYVME